MVKFLQVDRTPVYIKSAIANLNGIHTCILINNFKIEISRNDRIGCIKTRNCNLTGFVE